MKYAVRNHSELVQIHPVEGTRRIMSVDGHGQLVYFRGGGKRIQVLDVWKVMGDTDAWWKEYDAQTLVLLRDEQVEEHRVDGLRNSMRSIDDLPEIS